ncbi:MAG: DoxX family protein [Gemmatimonadota bacterium]
MTTSPPSSASTTGRTALHVTLWVVQVLLAVLFGMAGFMKTTLVMPELGEKLFWTKDVALPLVRFIGASELSASLGLLLPALARVKPMLTAWAAAGLVAFVAWGRFTDRPIAER